MTIRSYSEFEKLVTYEQRYEYLRLKGAVGESTFGFNRFINQHFYRSREWKQVREEVIYRDNGCDLGVSGHEIHDMIHIHHMNPMTIEAIEDGDLDILNPEFLISTTQRTHNAIHYGDKSLIAPVFAERKPGDTDLW